MAGFGNKYPAGRVSDNVHSALLTLCSSLMFTINDGLMKLILTEYDLFLSLFIRGVFALPMLVILCVYERMLSFRLGRRDTALIIGRALCEIGLSYCLLTALMQMPLATLTALLQSSPLFLSLVAFMCFGERFRWRRWIALGVGYIGVLIIIRPSETVSLSAALFGLASVGFIVARDCFSRLFSDEVPTLFPALVNVMAVMVFGALCVRDWQFEMPSVSMSAIFAATALTIILANMLVVAMMRKGDIGFVSQFRYSAILFSIIAGYLLFGEWPDLITLAGASLVIGAGLYSFARERQAG